MSPADNRGLVNCRRARPDMRIRNGIPNHAIRKIATTATCHGAGFLMRSTQTETVIPSVPKTKAHTTIATARQRPIPVKASTHFRADGLRRFSDDAAQKSRMGDKSMLRSPRKTALPIVDAIDIHADA